MRVTKTGDWALARSLLSSAPTQLKAAIGTALRQEAQLLRKEIVAGITSQAPGGEPFRELSPLTLAARKLAGFKGTKALIVRADLRNAIAAIVRGDEAFIGVPRKAKGKRGSPLVDVARIHEFGAGPFVVPITPAMRRYLFVLLSKAQKAQRHPGSSKGVIVVTIPARPFLRPAFRVFEKGASTRFLKRVAIGMGLLSKSPRKKGASV
jgi:hypothetical protein